MIWVVRCFLSQFPLHAATNAAALSVREKPFPVSGSPNLKSCPTVFYLNQSLQASLLYFSWCGQGRFVSQRLVSHQPFTERLFSSAFLDGASQCV